MAKLSCKFCAQWCMIVQKFVRKLFPWWKERGQDLKVNLISNQEKNKITSNKVSAGQVFSWVTSMENYYSQTRL